MVKILGFYAGLDSDLKELGRISSGSAVKGESRFDRLSDRAIRRSLSLSKGALYRGAKMIMEITDEVFEGVGV